MDVLKKKIEVKNNIYCFNISDQTTKSVTDFYKDNPFPNYKNEDNKASILNSGDKNYLAKIFKNFVGFNKKVLEIGCGTGQLSAYFAIGTNNQIIGLDPTLASLQLATKFSSENNLKNIKFVNADIFDDVFKENSFDYIWCNGVLHHTKDPYGAFKISIKYLKKNGYILIGLYNKVGRIRTHIRKYIYRLFGKKIILKIDPILRKKKLKSDDQIDAWIRDQYIHPVESTHSYDEVLKWFKDNNIDFINSIPKVNYDELNKDLFKKTKKGNIFTRLLSQISMIFNSYGDDGGLFIFIGKKNA